MATLPTPANHDDKEVTKLEYAVLYYKRKKKVHGSRNVSKLDGILIIERPPTCRITLRDESSNSDEEGDDVFDMENSPQGKRSKSVGAGEKSKGPSSTVYTEINKSLSQRAFGICESSPTSDSGIFPTIDPPMLKVDEIISLPQFDCEIVSVRGAAPANALPPRSGCGMLVGAKRSSTGLKRIPLQRRHIVSKNTSITNLSTLNTATEKQKNGSVKRDHLQVHAEDEDTKTSPQRPLKTCHSLRQPLKRIKKYRSAPSPSVPEIANFSQSLSSDFPGAVGTIIVPASAKQTLRPHQREGIAFLWNCLTGSSARLRQTASDSGLASVPRGAILADEMGLGKTLMTIATIFAMHRRQRDRRFIIVCPSSLVVNWAKEFDKWIGKASEPKRVVVRKGGSEGLTAMRAFVPVKPNKSEVLIVSYDMFRMNSAVLSQSELIGLLVVDEGHRLKNTAGSLTLTALESLRSEARLLISGTPIQNNLSEFYNLASFVCPGMLGDLPSFRREYERPITAANRRNATDEEKHKGSEKSVALESISSTFMIRRLQKDVLSSILPPRTEYVLLCLPSDLQRRCYENISGKILAKSSGSTVSRSGSATDPLVALNNLRKVCCHPLLLDEQEAHDGADRVEMSGKLFVLESLLRAIRTIFPGEKVVIVSNFTSALNVIQSEVLAKNKWPSLRLDGQTPQADRQRLVDAFNSRSVQHSFVFLLSAKAGGCGLNLIGANRLVQWDPDYNPATDLQAMARIYRQGQTRPCFVYRTFTAGTAEEVILNLQLEKQKLALSTIDGTSVLSSPSTLSEDQLRDCFTLKELDGKHQTFDGMKLVDATKCHDHALSRMMDTCQKLSAVHQVETPSSPSTPPNGTNRDEENMSTSSTDEEEWDDE